MIEIKDDSEVSEINVTPFIDVMLVLLIIFMIVAPLITNSLDIELPKADLSKPDDDKTLVLSISSDGKIAVNDEEIAFGRLEEALWQKSGQNKETPIYFSVDKSVKYEVLIEIIEQVKSLQYAKIALVAQSKEQ